MLWSLKSVSLRPHSIPYDFGFMTTRRRFSQVIRINPDTGNIGGCHRQRVYMGEITARMRQLQVIGTCNKER